MTDRSLLAPQVLQELKATLTLDRLRELSEPTVKAWVTLCRSQGLTCTADWQYELIEALASYGQMLLDHHVEPELAAALSRLGGPQIKRYENRSPDKVAELRAALSAKDQQLLEQRMIGHADGQQHTIADVNTGLIDDMIQPRLEAAIKSQNNDFIEACFNWSVKLDKADAESAAKDQQIAHLHADLAQAVQRHSDALVKLDHTAIALGEARQQLAALRQLPDLGKYRKSTLDELPVWLHELADSMAHYPAVEGLFMQEISALDAWSEMLLAALAASRAPQGETP